jgi:hypothetical protein
MLREHVEQLAQEMRRLPDPTATGVSRRRRAQRITNLLQLRTRRLRRARLRAQILDY